MASTPDHISMALFCDFENVALGVREANYDKFDIKKVLERLLLKGSIVVKKAYCDWERYRGFKAAMHEANFELIEIPHVRQSGKNSADIRMVVDALDLCYTKSHVNTFVIISGDSDFSPLVSKLRENAKYVIGVGVKQSTSDLLIANCDEFIFYDDLVRDSQRQSAMRRDGRDQPQPRRSPEEEAKRKADMDKRRTKAVEMAAETYEALVTDRDEGGRIWASVLKEAIKRRNPGFNENYYGFRLFGNLLEEAQARGLLEFGRDEKSGTWVARGSGVPTAVASPAPIAAEPQSTDHEEVHSAHNSNEALLTDDHEQDTPAAPQGGDEVPRSGDDSRGRRRSRGGRGRHKGERHEKSEGRGEAASAQPTAAPVAPVAPAVSAPSAPSAPATTAPAADVPAPAAKKAARKSPARKAAAKKVSDAPQAATPAAKAPARKSPARKRAAKPAGGDTTAE